MAVTTPDEDPTVATPVLLLLHVPPDGDDVSVTVLPGQAVGIPSIAPVAVTTVTVADVAQPRLVV
jgi:hypothetical protein